MNMVALSCGSGLILVTYCGSTCTVDRRTGWQKDVRWFHHKKHKAENYDITKFLLLPDTHYKCITAKENFESFSNALRVHLVKYTTISSSKAPKSYAKLVIHMHYENVFELLIAVVFYMSPQIWVIGPKAQYLVIPFWLGEGKSLPYFLLRALAIRSELVLKRDQTGYIKKPHRKIHHGTVKS